MSDNDTLPATDADAFRQKCRDFLQKHATGLSRSERANDRGASMMAAAKEFQNALADANLAGLTYEKAYGGAGLTKMHDLIWREEYANFADMTGELTISHGMCLPVLNQFGSEEQKKRFLPDNIAGRTVWCQMFSEPGAGSDVASLQTKA
ncbi:MAG: acyl-CoA dehydrogenase, partial [Actinobacteria bacterium]|nr:acyl-CoA dehydrogenase [Actinomycetota bacterium]